MEIKSIEKSNKGNCAMFPVLEVRQLEADYKEAIEALITVQEKADSIYNTELSVSYYKKIIEKAYGESWDKIRENYEH